MNKLRNLFLSMVALCAITLPAAAQATLSSTTLSAAISDAQTRTVSLASTSSVYAPSATSSNPQTFLLVDKELMSVNSVNTTTNTVTVTRGVGGTKAFPHNSNTTVYYGQGNYFTSYDRAGGCTSAKELVLPLFNTVNGAGYDCRSAGQWIKLFDGTMTSGAVEAIRAFCTGTVGSGETEFLVSAACSGQTTSTTRYLVPQSGQIANLHVYSSAAAVGGSGKDVLTVLDNGTATALTCTIAASGTTCSDATHSVAVAAGDVLTFKFVTATSDTAANITVGLERY